MTFRSAHELYDVGGEEPLPWRVERVKEPVSPPWSPAGSASSASSHEPAPAASQEEEEFFPDLRESPAAAAVIAAAKRKGLAGAGGATCTHARPGCLAQGDSAHGGSERMSARVRGLIQKRNAVFALCETQTGGGDSAERGRLNVWSNPDSRLRGVLC